MNSVDSLSYKVTKFTKYYQENTLPGCLLFILDPLQDFFHQK